MTRFKSAMPVIHLPEVDSTSNHLAHLPSEEFLEEFTVVMADFQTAGKGQRGNSWESERGKNLLFSVVMYPEFLEARKQFLLSKAVALAIKEELDTMAEGFSIKWPNDIYWGEKKICGILIENDLMGSSIKRSIAGIGINVNQRQFHSPAPNPVSLLQITRRETDRTMLLQRIMERLTAYYALLKAGQTEEISERYHASLFRKAGWHLYQDAQGEFLAKIVMVRPEGMLILKDQSGQEREYAFKEVRYVIG